MDRGIIAAPGTIELGLLGMGFKPNLSPEDIRFYLLYWDRIIIPTNSLFHFGIPDEDDLIKSKAIWRPSVQLNGNFSGNELGEAIISAQCEVADFFLKDKSTDWVVHQIGKDLYLPEHHSKENNVIKVDISNSLPVPDKSVNINEILEFKERRKDELIGLHCELDLLYLDILKSPDPALSTKKTISDFKKSIDNLTKVSNEKFKTSTKFDLSAEININGKDIFTAMAAGAFIDSLATGFTIPIATVSGAVASAIKIKGKSTKTLNAASKNNKLAYLSKASKEKIIQPARI